MSVVIAYHRADMDGRCSGAIAYKYFLEQKIEPILVGIDYDDPESTLTKYANPNNSIVILDFCFNTPDKILDLAERVKKLVWIDHHVSVIRKLDLKRADAIKNMVYILDLNYAACELTWKYFYTSLPTPHAVTLLGRYDVWKHDEVPYCREFQLGIKADDTSPNNLHLWGLLLDTKHYSMTFVNHIINEGKIIFKYVNQDNADYINSFAFPARFEGLKAVCVNRGKAGSTIFDSITDRTQLDLLITFYQGKNGVYSVSLYKANPDSDIDVSKLASKYGGGGHKGAAGFQINDPNQVLIRKK